MTAELITGVSTLSGVLAGIWIGWRMHHLHVVEEVKTALRSHTLDLKEKMDDVHMKLSKLEHQVLPEAISKTMEEVSKGIAAIGTNTIVMEVKENSTLTNN